MLSSKDTSTADQLHFLAVTQGKIGKSFPIQEQSPASGVNTCRGGQIKEGNPNFHFSIGFIVAMTVFR